MLTFGISVAITTPVSSQNAPVGRTLDLNLSRTADFKKSRRESRRHHDRAVRLATNGQLDEAISEDEQAIACNQNDPGPQILMGRLLVEHGDLEEALACYKHVCQRFPHDAQPVRELMYGLQVTIAVLNLDCVRNVSPSAAGDSRRHPVTVVQVAAQKANATYDRERTSGKTARHLLGKLMADGRLMADPLY